jgi:ABC-2 type transport system ATP-binding protein
METPDEDLRVEKKISDYERSGMWSHAAELADKHSEKTKEKGLKMRALDKIPEVLSVVGLSEDAHKKVGVFSRGMRQRLGIAEVLIKDPKVLFLDEPTLGLDPDGAIRVIELIQSLNRERKITVLISSHNLQQVQKISHRVGIMIRGKMVAEGSIEALGKEKFGVGEEKYTLEEIYMKYFQEG